MNFDQVLAKNKRKSHWNYLTVGAAIAVYLLPRSKKKNSQRNENEKNTFRVREFLHQNRWRHAQVHTPARILHAEPINKQIKGQILLLFAGIVKIWMGNVEVRKIIFLTRYNRPPSSSDLFYSVWLSVVLNRTTGACFSKRDKTVRKRPASSLLKTQRSRKRPEQSSMKHARPIKYENGIANVYQNRTGNSMVFTGYYR